MPTIELGVNDVWRQGKEVVGRHDIIPVATEEWIRLEGVEFHSCIQKDEYEKSRTLRFKPPDACYIELIRFRVRPPKNRELPLQLKAQWVIMGKKVRLNYFTTVYLMNNYFQLLFIRLSYELTFWCQALFHVNLARFHAKT